MAQVVVIPLTNWPSPWPASYHGHGIRIEASDDGTYVGLVEGGYRSVLYVDAGEALADVTAWIECREGGENGL